jgi:hypothetical protein
MVCRQLFAKTDVTSLPRNRVREATGWYQVGLRSKELLPRLPMIASYGILLPQAASPRRKWRQRESCEQVKLTKIAVKPNSAPPVSMKAAPSRHSGNHLR